jgi:hypothetical protein
MALVHATNLLKGKVMNDLAQTAAREFFRLAVAAARYGGFWVGAYHEAAVDAAVEIGRKTGIQFEDALSIVEMEGQLAATKHGHKEAQSDWYEWLNDIQPYGLDDFDTAPYEAAAIARQAVLAAKRRG